LLAPLLAAQLEHPLHQAAAEPPSLALPLHPESHQPGDLLRAEGHHRVAAYGAVQFGDDPVRPVQVEELPQGEIRIGELGELRRLYGLDVDEVLEPRRPVPGLRYRGYPQGSPTSADQTTVHGLQSKRSSVLRLDPGKRPGAVAWRISV